MILEKEQVLATLSAALLEGVPDAPEHTVASVKALVSAPVDEDPVDIRRGDRKGRKALAFLLILLAFAGGTVLGYLMPEPVRDLAYRAGLPVESTRLVDARQTLHDLGVALGEQDRNAVRERDQELIRLVESLDADEHAKIDPEARQIHLRAVSFLAG
ncbi:MAG: hypothetical protein ACRDIU_07115 [Actinomycetota bacterium]